MLFLEDPRALSCRADALWGLLEVEAFLRCVPRTRSVAMPTFQESIYAIPRVFSWKPQESCESKTTVLLPLDEYADGLLSLTQRTLLKHKLDDTITNPSRCPSHRLCLLPPPSRCASFSPTLPLWLRAGPVICCSLSLVAFRLGGCRRRRRRGRVYRNGGQDVPMRGETLMTRAQGVGESREH